MIEEYLTKSEALKACFLVVDIRHAPSKDDILMYQYLKHFALKVIVIATKKDKIGKTMIPKQLKLIKETLTLAKEDNCYPVSSVTKAGMEEIDKIILSYIETE